MKLNLNELKVKSFVTSLEDSELNTVKGGILSTEACNSDFYTLKEDCSYISKYRECDPLSMEICHYTDEGC